MRLSFASLLLVLGLGIGLAVGGCEKVLPTKPEIQWVKIPLGSFTMGSPETEPGREGDERAHHVEIIRPLVMSATEITQKQWRQVMGGNPSYFDKCGETCPVEQVSWYDALEFCNKLSKLEALEPCYTIVATDVAWKRDCNGYRLPTESEWEYAARAGTTTALPNGELSVIDCRRDPKLDDVAWYCANSTVTYKGCLDIAGWGGPKCAGPHPVARKQPNAWGLYDMHGNVMEWVWDWFGAYPDAVTKETADADAVPSGWRRVNRGGGWYNYAKFCRSALRNHDGASARGNGLGFRIVRTDYSK